MRGVLRYDWGYVESQAANVGDAPMNRRQFLVAGGSVAAVGLSSLAVPSSTRGGEGSERRFKLDYAPHFGLFENLAGRDPVDQLKFAADQGFTAWEDNGMARRPVAEQERIARAMEKLGMRMGVFVATASFSEVTFAGTDQGARERVLQDIKQAIEVAKRVNARWMTVVPGLYDRKLPWDYQTYVCIELLKRCCELLEPHGLVMVLEPLNRRTNHPGVFLYRSDQAYLICKAVNSPSCKILFDIYHQQITEGNLIPNIDLVWDEIGYFQAGDNPGRKEPGTGEINYRNVFAHIYRKGYTGIIGMEHGKSRPGPEGEKALIDAYVWADSFDA